MMQYLKVFWIVSTAFLGFSTSAQAEIINHQVLIGSRDLPVLLVQDDAQLVYGPQYGDLRFVNGAALYTPRLEEPGTDWIEVVSGGIRHRIAIRIQHTFNEFHGPETMGRGPVSAAEDVFLSITRIADLPQIAGTGFAPHIQSATPLGEQILVTSTGTADDASFFLIGSDGTVRSSLSISTLLFDRLGLDIDVTDPSHGGLRGVAAHPEFQSNGRLYLSANTTGDGIAQGPLIGTLTPDMAHYASLVELTVSVPAIEGGRFEVLDARAVFHFGMQSQQHGIRQIGFNPYLSDREDGFGDIFVAVGDNNLGEGSDGDQAVVAPFGTILRLNPAEDISPDVDIESLVFARGLRNPHNLFFLADGRLAIVDVGADDFEELNIAQGGEDFGWPSREGLARRIADGGSGVDVVFPGPDPSYSEPAAVLSHPVEGPEQTQIFAIAGGGTLQLPSGDFGILLSNFTHGGEAFLVRGTDLSQEADVGQTSRVEQLTIRYDHDYWMGTTGWLTTSLTDLGFYLRSDARIHRLDDRRVLITMKSTTAVFVGEIVAPAL